MSVRANVGGPRIEASEKIDLVVAAARLNVRVATLRRWTTAGLLMSSMDGQVRLEDLENFVKPLAEATS